MPAILRFAIDGRPDHDVRAAGRNQLVAARAAVDLAAPRRAWHRPHHPVLAPPGLDAFGGRAKWTAGGRLARADRRRRRQITTRHGLTVLRGKPASAVVAETHAGLAAEPARCDQVLEQGRRGEARFVELLVERSLDG